MNKIKLNIVILKTKFVFVNLQKILYKIEREFYNRIILI